MAVCSFSSRSGMASKGRRGDRKGVGNSFHTLHLNSTWRRSLRGVADATEGFVGKLLVVGSWCSVQRRILEACRFFCVLGKELLKCHRSRCVWKPHEITKRGNPHVRHSWCCVVGKVASFSATAASNLARIVKPSRIWGPIDAESMHHSSLPNEN